MAGPDNTSKNESFSAAKNQSAPRKTLLSEFRGTLKRFERTAVSGNAGSVADPEKNVELILSSDQLTREYLSGIAVIAFVGPSGTGKSTRAIKVARDNNIYYIIASVDIQQYPIIKYNIS